MDDRLKLEYSNLFSKISPPAVRLSGWTVLPKRKESSNSGGLNSINYFIIIDIMLTIKIAFAITQVCLNNEIYLTWS